MFMNLKLKLGWHRRVEPMSGESGIDGFTIRHGSLILEVGLVNLQSLKLHEETLNAPLRSLVEDIKRSGVVKHPVIVDRDSLTVLDGMHRVQALRRINCVRALTCNVDYQSRDVALKFWYRTLNDVDVTLALKLLEEMRLPLQRGKLDAKVLSSPDLVLALITRDDMYFSIKRGRKVEDAFDIVKILERRIQARGTLSYYIEDEALKKALRGEVEAALAIPKLSKKDIVELAGKGYLLPPKTTRHVIPARPMGVNVPLSLLMDRRMETEEANAVLVEQLMKRQIVRMGPGATYENRFYEEELYVFV
jgi:hypothetical protein